MTTDHPSSLDEIREAAEAAAINDAWFMPGEMIFDGCSVADATYIAMMDPQTTLALVERVEEAERREERADYVWRLDAQRAVSAEKLVHVLGEALRKEPGESFDYDDAIAAYRAFTEANPTPGAEA